MDSEWLFGQIRRNHVGTKPEINSAILYLTCELYPTRQLADFLDKIHVIDPMKRPSLNWCLTHPFIAERMASA